ncbi:hypothetical protein HG530_013143 [Fusarium avenaceum]|nr:hypothetical protein HG530_013143 [Fusarium avenaceum]
MIPPAAQEDIGTGKKLQSEESRHKSGQCDNECSPEVGAFETRPMGWTLGHEYGEQERSNGENPLRSECTKIAVLVFDAADDE